MSENNPESRSGNQPENNQSESNSFHWKSNWKNLLVAGVIVAGVVGGGYWTVAHSSRNQTAGNAPTPTQIAQSPTAKPAAEALNITVYRTPTCGCCQGWVEQIQQANFTVTDQVKPEAEIQAIRQKHGLPEELTACHTAEIDGYLVEGHVPIADVKQLIAQKSNLAGIAVPGMPMGTPGMEMGNRQESFEVLGFKPNGQTKTFNSYQF
ncbi:MAG: DUF411 domain-containing protein [Oscillatoriales cyanobacterium RM2_1_1]|nr:DUF411 domain-containing protein [Oscillatoriales cyanobacterium SM2_3_0]NJO45470.1 DUF411 domain-containing protein [Oscillatoriales cyanobacterium RM2_1_1]